MSEEPGTTSLDNKCFILSELWLSHRDDPKFEELFYYHDVGLPLAYLVSEGLVEPSPLAKSMVGETFDQFLAAIDRKDIGFECLDDVYVG